MILEYFLVAVLHVGTPAQEILVLERVPTEKACNAKAQTYADIAPSELSFGCMASSSPTSNTI